MTIFLCCFSLALFLAWIASRLSAKLQRSLFIFLAFFLPVSEVIKQILLYVTNDHAYQWWYFPFQLCSMPLYLLPVWCLFALTNGKRTAGPCAGDISRMLATFLMDFGLLGGIAVFADQSGMQYKLPLLTFHSYLWHFLMIFLALYLFLTRKPGLRIRDFIAPAALFLILAAAATGLNILFHSKGSINMFYISPYHDMEQIIFRDAALHIGQTPAKLLYAASILLGGFVIHLFLSRLSRRLFPSSSSLNHRQGPQRPFTNL